MYDLLADLNFWVSQYFYLYPFLVPLGVIGAWRWSVWLIKKTGAYFYKPKKNYYFSNVSVVTPVYNEDPNIFLKVLNSWAKNGPSEIIAVIDYTDKNCIDIFRQFSKIYKNTKLIITKEPGKRPALAKGIKEAKEKIVALVDSDTFWTDNVIQNALPPFEDERVAGVATYQNVLQPKTLAQKIFDTQLDLRYSDELPFLAATGDALVCLSGRTAFYKKSAILPLLDDLVNETFWGEKVISGDDKRLTYLVLEKGWKVAFQNNSKVYTPGMENIWAYLKQRLRWTRNSIRADLRALLQGWPFKHPSLLFFQLDKIVQGFVVVLSPIYFLVSLFTGLYIEATAIFIWWFVSRFIKMYPHLKRRPQDITILPFFIIYSFLTAILKVYAFFTLNTQGWITRWDKIRLPQIKFARIAFAYSSTIATLILLIFGVFYYKQLTYFQPFETRQKFIASVLPPISALDVANDKKVGPNNNDLLSKKYQVQEGESLGSIASKFGIDINTLREANISRLTNWNSVEPGFIVNIPGKDVKLSAQNKFNFQRIYPDILQIVYDQNSKSIVVSGRREKITLRDIKNSVGNQYLEETQPKVWDLKASLYIRSGVTLTLDKNEVEWLRLASNKKGFSILRAFNGTIFINGVKISSWDNEKKDYDKDTKDGRSYILVKDGSRMDIYNSDLSYLGYPRTPDLNASPYGVSWRMSNGKLGTTLLTGEIINSKFHHNYFGAYTFGATGMKWVGNEFFDNIKYGLDPHDDSNGFLVENNKFYNNGSHGLIFSKRCINNTIRNNISYNNKLHGIMLHEKSNNNLIENNILYGNKADGVALWRSSNNLIRNNAIKDNNKSGVRGNMSSNSNVIIANTITANVKNGVYFYENANSNIIRDNNISNNFSAIYIRSKDNELVKNTLDGNRIGIYLLDQAFNNKLLGNKITNNKYYGIYSKIPNNQKNLLSLNNFERNRFNIIAR